MDNGYATEELEAILESLEEDEAEGYDEYAERTRARGGSRGRGRAAPPKTGTGAGLVPAKPNANYVTESRLEAALARVGAQIKTNADAIKSVNERVNALGADIARQTAAIKKEADDRKKDMNSIKSNLQLLTLLPLLGGNSTKNVIGEKGVEGTDLQKGDKIVIDKGNSLSALLPVLLLGGLSPSPDGSAAANGANDQSNMLVLALALSGGLGGK